MKEKLLYLLKHPLQIPILLVTKCMSRFNFLYETSDYQNQVNFKFWWKQKMYGTAENKAAYWPVHSTSQVYDVANINVGVDAYPGIMGGCYITGKGGLVIGDYTQIAPNVVIVTANHNLYDSRKHIAAPVNIGKYCWLGAGCKVMPGVTLGEFTIVAAGAVVTKSFEEGYCVIAGVPAKKIKELNKNLCIPFENKKKYKGYIAADKFDAYRKKYLNF